MNINDHNVIKKLYERELIAQITNKKKLIKIAHSHTINLYCGFDPTADSLHIGHLIPLLCLQKFQKLGHHPLVLLGGATGLIGDPSFKKSERKMHRITIIQEWIEKIKHQIFLFIDCSQKKKKQSCIINNYDWFSSISMLDFLRDIGKFFSINKMINKESIKQRLQRNNCGISYTEFSYNLLQSYDFMYLHKNYGTILQIGGSDQWGNIVSGIDLTRRIYKKVVYGLTTPLMTKSDNTKFGKTETNTIWLDPNKTSPYKFYQYWLNTSDKEVYRFLKFFTDLSIESINTLQKEDNNNDNIKPKAQFILASKITKLVHGTEQLKSAQRITDNLFTGKILQLTAHDFIQLAKDGIPTIKFKQGITLKQALVASKLVTSLTQARALIMSNGVTINTQKQLNTEYVFCSSDRLHNYYTLLKKGKKNYCLIQWD